MKVSLFIAKNWGAKTLEMTNRERPERLGLGIKLGSIVSVGNSQGSVNIQRGDVAVPNEMGSHPYTEM